VQIANSLIGAEVPAVRAAIEGALPLTLSLCVCVCADAWRRAAHPRWADFARGDLAELNKRNATVRACLIPALPR
jgi:hypothetical protein